MSIFDAHSCWRRTRRSDIERPSSLYSGSNKLGWAKNCKSSSLSKSSDMLQRLFYVQRESSSACKQGLYVRTAAPASEASHICIVVLWPERMSKTDTEEKKLMNKVILVFFAHKKYSCSFIKLRLNHWCHMDYFNDVLTTFLGLERFSCIAVYAGSESSRISSKIS